MLGLQNKDIKKIFKKKFTLIKCSIYRTLVFLFPSFFFKQHNFLVLIGSSTEIIQNCILSVSAEIPDENEPQTSEIYRHTFASSTCLNCPTMTVIAASVNTIVQRPFNSEGLSGISPSILYKFFTTAP